MLRSLANASRRVQAVAPTTSLVRCSAVASYGQSVVSRRPLVATPIAVHHRNLNTNVNADVINAQVEKLLAKWKQASVDSIMHQTNYSLLVLTPVAFALSPSIFNFPVDLALGVIVPVHMHIGLTTVLTDYIPRPAQTLSLLGLGLATALTLLGLLKINLCGPGITESVKSLWRAPKAKKDDKKKAIESDKKVVAAAPKADKIKIEVVEDSEKPKKKKAATKE